MYKKLLRFFCKRFNFCKCLLFVMLCFFAFFWNATALLCGEFFLVNAFGAFRLPCACKKLLSYGRFCAIGEV